MTIKTTLSPRDIDIYEAHKQKLQESAKFQKWEGRVIKMRAKPFDALDASRLEQAAIEKHFTPQELAETWGVSVQTIREIFKDEEGVLKIGKDGTRTRRAYKTLRIPESVAERIHTRLSA
jgi:hypothetical protein